LIEAGLIKDGDAIPFWWEVKEADVERFTHEARMVLIEFEAKARRSSSAPSPPPDTSDHEEDIWK
jgi:hypothetical protein